VQETALRTTARLSEAEEWALVLTAAGIPSRLQPAAEVWTLFVPEADVAKACDALDAYDAEMPVAAVAPPAAAMATDTAWTIGLIAALLLLGFFAISGPAAAGSRWFARGAAAAGLMLHGEPWRAVTALTLHVDTMHVVGNAVATALLLPLVVQSLGAGVGVWLVLLAGAGGNVLAAMVHEPSHVAAGASTATFGAIGILAALRVRLGSTGRRWWVAPVATLVLLAMLGMSRGADVAAHALGLLTGGVLGSIGGGFRRPLAPPIQWVLAAAAALAVVGCWHLALTRGAG
jgi:membrane associated rhomboid family serine protease